VNFLSDTKQLSDSLHWNSTLQEFVENGAVMILNGLFDCNLDSELCEMKVGPVMGCCLEVGHVHTLNKVSDRPGRNNQPPVNSWYAMFGVFFVAGDSCYFIWISFLKPFLEPSLEAGTVKSFLKILELNKHEI
jgi:hypothetical protein